MTEEDEAFNEIERQAKQRKESVMAQLTPTACERCKQLEEQAYDLLGRLQAANLSIDMLKMKARYKDNTAIEEVAQHIEQMKGFGQDTISSLAIYIRAMKK
jgi:hypothetical protein